MTPGGAHLGDDAELYALGALEPVERAAAEAHIAGCEGCAAQVARAEAVGAALAAALPLYEPPAGLESRLLGRRPGNAKARTVSAWLAVAAAAAALVGVLGWQDASLKAGQAREAAAFQTLVHSHFLHAPFTKLQPSAPDAKVLFARDGAWLYILVDRAAPGMRAVLRRHGADRDAGELHVDGSASSLFVSGAGRPDAVVLRDASGPQASAALAYPRSP
jgi:hypothetical protein